MLRSVDCMYWEWKICLVTHHGAYIGGHHGCATIILEAMASFDTWIWHANFGMPSLHNDLNVLYSSPLFNDILEGRAPRVLFYVNGKEYSQGYFYFMLMEKNIVRNTIFQMVFIWSGPPSSNQSQPIEEKKKYVSMKQETNLLSFIRLGLIHSLKEQKKNTLIFMPCRLLWHSYMLFLTKNEKIY